MGLMTGTGPLGRKPAGRFNFEPPPPGKALYLDPSPKRIRVVVAGETIADSRRASLLHESGHQPIYYFPAEDVRADVLEPSDRRTRCPKKGEASYYTVRVGDRVIEDAAWYYPDPIDGAPPIHGLIAFYWSRVDQWFEEAEEIAIHPRDPYHRIDVIRTDRHIKISVDGELLAETDRALALFESNLPTRWYLPEEDISAELLPSDSVTGCPYKGYAAYRSVRGRSGEVLEDLIWTYSDPFDEVSRIAGLFAFYNERVDIELDGELQERPETPWSRGTERAANAPAAQTRG
jgi:uncharacterized protein (DUF427 family)